MGAEGSRLYSPGEESPRLLGSPSSPAPATSPTTGKLKSPATFSTVDLSFRGNLANKMFMVRFESVCVYEG